MKKKLIISLLTVGVSSILTVDAKTYDNLHRLKTETYADGSTVEYTYDRAGNLSKVEVVPAPTRDEDGDGIPDGIELANGGDLDPNADLDNDGRSNFEEYAFGLDPSKSDGVQPTGMGAIVTGTDGKKYQQFHYRRPKNSLATYTPQISTTLGTWNQGAAFLTQESVTDNPDGTEKVTLKCLLPIDENAKIFFRVKAEKN